MKWFSRIPFLRKLVAPPKRTRKVVEESALAHFFETNRLVSVAIFIATTALIAFISYVGTSPHTLPILPNQMASVRIVAAVPFEYESRLRTQHQRELIRTRVPPVFRLEMSPYEQFQEHFREMVTALDLLKPDDTDGAPSPSDVAGIVEAFNQKGPYRASVEDVMTLLTLGDSQIRNLVVRNALATLREIYREGVYDEGDRLSSPVPGGVSVFTIIRPDGDAAEVRVQSMEDALTFLRINLAAEGFSREVVIALYRLFRLGLVPNLVFDADATETLRQQAVENMERVIVTVERGQSIIEPGNRVAPEQHEMLLAHRRVLEETGELVLGENLDLFGRILLVMAMVLASVFFIRMEDRETLLSNGRLALLAIVLIINISLVRLAFTSARIEWFQENSAAFAALPFLSPTALGPLILAILVGSRPAILMALFVSLFTAVIYGNRLEILVITFLASLVGIFACRQVRKRGKVVRAAFWSGVTVAVFTLLVGMVDRLNLATILWRMAAGVTAGLGTGVVVAGLLPVLESLFRRTTDITLLELTDFNHPLLRRMQIEAPGTYHHSLMVASLSENAANVIGANGLLCRVCCLFHDIGKMVKPEYFAENQRGIGNPHDERSPSISALIIKSHVKEGVSLAIKNHLPRVVIDVIQQHHGTSLIKFFYHRARAERSTSSRSPFLAPGRDVERVCETTYRYDGPRPRFKESAIIFFADGVEAASRSLPRVTPQHLGELIERIFTDRIADGQLDECPITLDEIAKIKRSFQFTLLSSLHSRIAYPGSPQREGPPVEELATAVVDPPAPDPVR